MILRGRGIGRSSVVTASEFKSEDPGFDPVGGDSFSIPPSQLLCRFDYPDPPWCVRHAPTFVRTLKIPYPSVVTEQASQPLGFF